MTTPSPNPDDVTTRLRRTALSGEGGELATKRRSDLMREAADLIGLLRRQLAERDAALEMISAPKRLGDSAAGWEIVAIPKLGRRICWEIEHDKVLPTLTALVAGGARIWSVTPVAAYRCISERSAAALGEPQ